jgi:hypothetical protein
MADAVSAAPDRDMLRRQRNNSLPIGPKFEACALGA